MVYYHTSSNTKMLQKILLDFAISEERRSSCEYIKKYIDNCPDSMDDPKILWLVETFLCLQKHNLFLKDMVSHLGGELSQEDQDYFMIVLNGIIFHLSPTEKPQLYKCLFNLSKPLLNTFTGVLSNNEILTSISQIAHVHYDTNFITEKIITPLYTWQPYISEMAHSYAEFVKQTQSRKIKLPTIPIQPNLLSRKNKDISSQFIQAPVPSTPPNSLNQKRKKMLTKDVIDKKLNQIHENNKRKGLELLQEIKTKDFHFAQGKTEKYFKKISNLRDEVKTKCVKTLPKIKQANNSKEPVVKETVTTVKRLGRRIQISENEEIEWLQNLLKNYTDTLKVDKLEEYDRQERERQRFLDIEKKHLMGQISYEDAVIAKKKLYEENKKKYNKFLREKQSWDEEIERWKRDEMEKNRKQVEKLSLLELEMLHAKHAISLKKKESADVLRKETEELVTKAMKEKQDYLECRIKMIQEIKILHMIAKKARVPKIIDLTESSGLGLLCEMSIAELQERLSFMKIGLKEELENKKRLIRDENLSAKRELEETKISIKNYMDERSSFRKSKEHRDDMSRTTSSKEIDDLKKVLEEKRKLRILLSTN